MTDVKNTIDYINDLYEDINEEAHFDYQDREKTKVYTSYDEKEEFQEVDLIHVKYNYDFYFTKEFRKIRKDITSDIDRLYFDKDDEKQDEEIQFIFPRSSSHLIVLQPELQISYNNMFDLIISKAKDVAIQLIQTSYIKYIYEENEKIVRDNKKMAKALEATHRYVINVSEENIKLTKRMDELEKTLSNLKFGKKVPKTVI